MQDPIYKATVDAHEALSEIMTRHSECELNDLRDNLETIHSLFDDRYGHNSLADSFPELSHTISQVIEDIEYALQDIKIGTGD